MEFKLIIPGMAYEIAEKLYDFIEFFCECLGLELTGGFNIIKTVLVFEDTEVELKAEAPNGKKES